MNNKILSRKLTIPASDVFSPAKTFDCGQCFRFDERDGYIEGVVGKAIIKIKNEDTTGEIVYLTSGDETLDLFFDPAHSYFDMTEAFTSSFSGREREALESATSRGFGIRILKQDFWETLVSFIISQNNNIPRIKKNIASICEKFGEAFEVEGKTYYSFPTPEALIDAGETGLNECKLGFRVKYILDASKKVASGEINEKELLALGTAEASAKLQTISGVGPKVAACVLLYGLARLETVPVDVWMKKVFSKYFDTTPDLGIWGGVAQQYLFYNERYIQE